MTNNKSQLATVTHSFPMDRETSLIGISDPSPTCRFRKFVSFFSLSLSSFPFPLTPVYTHFHSPYLPLSHSLIKDQIKVVLNIFLVVKLTRSKFNITLDSSIRGRNTIIISSPPFPLTEYVVQIIFAIIVWPEKLLTKL